MNKRIVLVVIVLLAATGFVSGQQVADLKYQPPLRRPAYEAGKGPRVAIDEAHQNFHTAEGRYKPFAALLQRDGYRVKGLGKRLSPDSLNATEVVVIVNPLHERNIDDWSLPTPSAFTEDEITALRSWVEEGGSLLLIADHMPFPGAASDLAKAFEVKFSNGYARAGHWQPGQPRTFVHETGLRDNIITRGQADDETVTKVATFGGSAFKPPNDAIPILVFGANSVSLEMKRTSAITPKGAEVPIEGWCQGAVMKVGNGRLAVFGEAAMFSAQLAGAKRKPMGMNAPEAEQNHQLLLNVMHWLTRAKEMSE